jgi:hypothetical protein
VAADTRNRVQENGVAGSRRRDPIETKPFYMTSEFMSMALMTVALFAASIVVADVDSRLAWILGVSLVSAYVLSRGIAKAGTRSTSYDPREHLFNGDEPLTRERHEDRSFA